MYWTLNLPIIILDYGDIASSLVIWVFKNEINGIMAYIKLKDETERRGCVCLSFHEDEP